MAYAAVYEFTVSPASAKQGDRVDITLIIQNDAGVATSVMGDLTFAYGGGIYAVTYDSLSEFGTLDPGGYLVIQGHFTMPSQDVVITGHTYYYASDGLWHLDQTQTLNVSLSQWLQVAQRSLAVSYGTPLSGEFLLVAQRALSVTYGAPLAGQWLQVAQTTISVTYGTPLVGDWLQVASRQLSITYNVPAPLTIGTPSLTDAVVGAAYSQQLQASGGKGPYVWSIASGVLPAGLTLSAAGLISGKPTTVTTNPVSITFKVTDNLGATTTKALNIAVKATSSNMATYMIAAVVGAAALGLAALGFSKSNPMRNPTKKQGVKAK